ncbi:MAG: DMT family transporter [Rhizobiaceae bacterium]|nr:DMT family transporter [Rhizobiaceae bacterium]
MVPSQNQDHATPVPAILLICGSGLLFTVLDTSAKYLVLSGLSPQFVSWMRLAEHTLLAFILLKGWRNASVYRVSSLPRQLLRGIFLFGSTIFNFYALRTLQLAETMSISFFAPMLITALAGPFLGEWAGWRRWLAILFGFAGVLVITRPGFVSFNIGHVFALMTTLSYCFYVLMTRAMSTSETPESMIFYSALAPTLLMAPVLPGSASMPPDLFHWVLLLSLGIYGGLGHWMIIRAYRIATTTALAPYPYLQMIWMILLGYLVFDQLPDRWTIVGAAIIVASGLYIVHREHRLRVVARSAPTSENETLAKRL